MYDKMNTSAIVEANIGLVSIIVPIYNVEDYLEQAIKNILNQTYKNIEVLLVIDGSTDNSAKIAGEYEKQDRRIRILYKENGGLSSARNYGLKHATGQYIYFYDPDDLIECNLVQTCMQTIGDKYVDYVSFGNYMETEAGSVLSKSDYHGGEIETDSREDRVEFILNTLLKYEKMGWNAWSKLFNREFLNKYDLYFPDNREVFAEDLAFMLRVALNQSRIVIMEQSLYHYVRHDESIMGQAKENDVFHKLILLTKNFQEYAKTYDHLDVSCINYAILRMHLWEKCKSSSELCRFVVNFYDHGEKTIIREWLYCINTHMLESCRKLTYGAILESLYLQAVLDGKKGLCRVGVSFIWKQYYNLKELKGILGCLLKQSKKGNHSNIYILGTEDFGNLGDHEIAEAEKKFLEKRYGSVVEVTASEYFNRKKELKREIHTCDILVLTGGGNIGDMYNYSEKVRRDVIMTWKNNFKIIFPQTLYYRDFKETNDELIKDKRCFREKYNVCLVARETESYEFASRNFDCNVRITPDIVLSVGAVDFDKQNKRTGCLLLLRKDEERNISICDELCVEDIIKQRFGFFKRADTSKPYNIPASVRKVELDSLLKKIASSELVITDRLHGMVFCAITATPCVVFENFNYKVRGTYEWIKTLPYIRLVPNVREAEKVIDSGFHKQEYSYDETLLSGKFQVLYGMIDKHLI